MSSAPFGVPVVPDVYRITAVSSACATCYLLRAATPASSLERAPGPITMALEPARARPPRGLGELLPGEHELRSRVAQVERDLAFLEQRVHRDDDRAGPQGPRSRRSRTRARWAASRRRDPRGQRPLLRNRPATRAVAASSCPYVSTASPMRSAGRSGRSIAVAIKLYARFSFISAPAPSSSPSGWDDEGSRHWSPPTMGSGSELGSRRL